MSKDEAWAETKRSWRRLRTSSRQYFSALLVSWLVDLTPEDDFATLTALTHLIDAMDEDARLPISSQGEHQ